MTALPMSDDATKKCFLLLQYVNPRSMEVDVLHFARFISTATYALIVVIANRRQCRCVMGAMVERRALYT